VDLWKPTPRSRDCSDAGALTQCLRTLFAGSGGSGAVAGRPKRPQTASTCRTLRRISDGLGAAEDTYQMNGAGRTFKTAAWCGYHCTNTSNLGAGGRWIGREESRRARATSKPWVKTSLAPGSKVVMDYLARPDCFPRSKREEVQPGGLRLHHGSATAVLCRRKRQALPKRN
jgi:hypothetical protein